MENLINIGVRSIFIDNMIFAYFLGMCSFLAISKKVNTAFGLGIAVVFVLGITVPINWLIQNYVLNAGALAWLGEDFASLDLNFLQFIVFISVIAAIVQLTEMAVEKLSPALYGTLGIFLPLIAVNCSYSALLYSWWVAPTILLRQQFSDLALVSAGCWPSSPLLALEKR